MKIGPVKFITTASRIGICARQVARAASALSAREAALCARCGRGIVYRRTIVSVCMYDDRAMKPMTPLARSRRRFAGAPMTAEPLLADSAQEEGELREWRLNTLLRGGQLRAAWPGRSAACGL